MPPGLSSREWPQAGALTGVPARSVGMVAVASAEARNKDRQHLGLGPLQGPEAVGRHGASGGAAHGAELAPKFGRTRPQLRSISPRLVRIRVAPDGVGSGPGLARPGPNSFEAASVLTDPRPREGGRARGRLRRARGPKRGLIRHFGQAWLVEPRISANWCLWLDLFEEADVVGPGRFRRARGIRPGPTISPPFRTTPRSRHRGRLELHALGAQDSDLDKTCATGAGFCEQTGLRGFYLAPA